MPDMLTAKKVPIEKLRWRLDPDALAFKNTDELEPLKEIIGQKRGVDAFHFGMQMKQSGYNVFVTGTPGSGRMATVRKLLEHLSKENGKIPDDLCYVNNFKSPEAPALLRLKAGLGAKFKKDIRELTETLKKEVPRLFESQEYLNRKKEIMEEYEQNGKNFFKNLDKKVREQGFALVDVQVGQIKRPEVVPLVDGNPTHLDQLEAMVEKGRFPKEEFEQLKEKHEKLRGETDQIFLDLRELQKGVQENIEKIDRLMFMKMAGALAVPLREKYPVKEIEKYLNDMLEDMTENLQIFTSQGQPAPFPGMPMLMPEGDPFQPYQVNLLVDNSEITGPPVVVETYPTYRNLFGSIERIVDRSGVWRTDFSKIKTGSLIKANGGYLVLNLMDAIVEPGVWPSLKRALKTKKMEIQTYDPFYLFTTTGLKPEPIEMDLKVVVIADEHIYHLLQTYDEDLPKIFKVRADFETSMNKDEKAITQFAQFIKMKQEEGGLRPFENSAVAALIEQAVRMSGRQEKISTSFPMITDLIREADYFAGQDQQSIVKAEHVDQAIDARIYRSNKVEEQIQEMIDRGTLMIDTTGEVVGQINGLAVYSLGDYLFGKPSRITATTSMGRSGIINIEREADMSGSTHNKGVLILGGYFRKRYAQDKPLTMSASIAFEQSYSGVDGDSASSTEVYALLSSLSSLPIKQSIAVTGSINQKGEIQPIGGVNQKIEGFFQCCRKTGLTGDQGVMIPESNVKDLMLRKEVVEAVKNNQFHVYAVKTVDEGIEILTGQPADRVNDLVDKKFRELAENLKNFGESEEKEDKKDKKSSCKNC